jgi:hypothetical protein
MRGQFDNYFKDSIFIFEKAEKSQTDKLEYIEYK